MLFGVLVVPLRDFPLRFRLDLVRVRGQKGVGMKLRRVKAPSLVCPLKTIKAGPLQRAFSYAFISCAQISVSSIGIDDGVCSEHSGSDVGTLDFDGENTAQAGG